MRGGYERVGRVGRRICGLDQTKARNASGKLRIHEEDAAQASRQEWFDRQARQHQPRPRPPLPRFHGDHCIKARWLGLQSIHPKPRGRIAEDDIVLRVIAFDPCPGQLGVAGFWARLRFVQITEQLR